MNSCSTIVLLLALGASDRVDQIVADEVDLMEVNHFYDQHGKHVFDQVIFYEWNNADSRYHVRAWRLIKEGSQYPVRDWLRGGYTATWHDEGLLRTVRAESIRETWTQHDPEIAEREHLPEGQRRRLYQPRSADVSSAGFTETR